MAKQRKKVVLIPVRLMVDEKQVRRWEKDLKKLGYDSNLSTYIEYATDRSFTLDFQIKDPKYQKFLLATNKIAKRILGFERVDSMDIHIEAVRVLEEQKKKV